MFHVKIKKKMIFVIATVSLITGCTLKNLQSQAKHQVDFFAMDTYMTITAYGTDGKSPLNQAKNEIKRVEREFSVTEENSTTAKLNAAGEDGIEVPEEYMELTKKALDVTEKTGGAFDLTIYPVLKLWGFTTGEYLVPNKVELRDALALTGFQKIQKDEENCRIALKGNAQVDFGGIAKGYAADRALEVLKKAGVSSAIVNLGGNVATLGTKPDGSLWSVAIRDPQTTDQYMGVLRVKDRAVVTSGGYERYFIDENGEKWCHIINPSDGYPVKNDLLSVTIVNRESTTADALSTAMYVLGSEKAMEYWKKNGEFEMILLTTDGGVIATEGLKNLFSLMENYEGREIKFIQSEGAE